MVMVDVVGITVIYRLTEEIKIDFLVRKSYWLRYNYAIKSPKFPNA